jgi:hypothetical protein
MLQKHQENKSGLAPLTDRHAEPVTEQGGACHNGGSLTTAAHHPLQIADPSPSIVNKLLSAVPVAVVTTVSHGIR